MTTTAKEAFYDDKIAPLMAEIIALCKREKICIAATFALGHAPDDPENPDREPLYCSTVLDYPDSDPKEVDRIQQLGRIMLGRRRSFMAMTIISKGPTP